MIKFRFENSDIISKQDFSATNIGNVFTNSETNEVAILLFGAWAWVINVAMGE